jgi:hypothetical protein
MARTTITNISGSSRYFGFLPPHGRTLDDSESVTVEGDLRTVLASGRGRYSRGTELASLTVAEEGGQVTVEAAAEPSSSSSSSV